MLSSAGWSEAGVVVYHFSGGTKNNLTSPFAESEGIGESTGRLSHLTTSLCADQRIQSARRRRDLHEIIAASFRGEAVEWREMENGDVTCIAYVRHGSIPDPRCSHTVEMFA